MREWDYKSKKITDKLGGKFIGEKMDVVIRDVSTIDYPLNHTMLFTTKTKWKAENSERLNSIKDCFIIIEEEIALKGLELCKKNNNIISTNNSRLYFAKALSIIINEKEIKREYKTIGNNIVIGENAFIGVGGTIEPFVFIDNDVKIGNNVQIKSGAKIMKNSTIEDNVIIGENSIIGAQGFGLERDIDGRTIRIPHIGGVNIGRGSEIGALSSIVAGTIEPTIIEKNCFIDDLCHIAHNCIIEEGTMITACSELSGSVKIGKNSYISPNATIRNGISLGADSFVGQASSVQKSFAPRSNLVGNPAREYIRKKI